MSKAKSKGKSTIVWVLMGLLVLGLGGFGIENFSGGGSNVGQVGEVRITADDYSRAVDGEMRAFAAQTGRMMTGAEAQAVGIPDNVLRRLFLAAVLEEQARRLGVSIGDQAVADQILAAPAFRGIGGNFDSAVYANVLRQEGLSVAQFEQQIRMDEARAMIQRAVASGANAGDAMVDRWTTWLLETRDIRWHELTADDLPNPVEEPDDSALEAWHQANADRFTAPEMRRITYAWINPDMIEGSVELDEETLRAEYERRIDEFQRPERRMVERIVFESEDAALAGKARVEARELSFEELGAERGLSLADIDLGETTRESLGAAGDEVFALEQPGIIGPLPSNFGPALYSMNAILEPVDIPFDQAIPELRGEAGLDRARRRIEDLGMQLDDLLAGGATLEELAAETDMELGRIEWDASMTPEHGSIAGYPAFREAAAAVSEQDFPEVRELDDGGLFILQLDEIVPPSLIPLDEVRDRVAEDWKASETHRRLLALADELKMNAVARSIGGAARDEPEEAAPAPDSVQPNPAPVPGAAQIVAPLASGAPLALAAPEIEDWHEVAALSRSGFVEGAPAALVSGAFDLSEPGEAEVVDADRRVFLVALDRINPVDLTTDEAEQVRDAVSRQLSDGLQSDLFEYYTRAIQTRLNPTVNQAAVDAVKSRM